MQLPRAEQTQGLAGRIVAGGAATRTAMRTLLGVQEAGAGWDVSAVAWMDHAVEVAVRDGESAPCVFRIERRKPESKGLILTAQLVVYTRGPAPPHQLVEAVRRTASRKLGALTLEHLAALVDRDPEAGKPGLPMPPSADEGRRPQSLLDTWGADDSYADFFAGGEVARGQLDSIDPTKLFRFAQHCDSECNYVNPRSLAGVVSVVAYPWDNRVRAPFQPHVQGMANLSDREFLEEGLVSTNLEEDDVIHGSQDKLQKLLKYVTERPNPDGKIIFFSNTCVPTVTGEDVESLVRRARRRTGKPILYLTVTPRSMTSVFHPLLQERRRAAEDAAEPPLPQQVNLIGYPGGPAGTELRSLLGEAGITVNASLIPDLTHALVDALPKASLSVFCPNRLWQHLYDQLLSGTRIPQLMPPAPFGMDATRQWFSAVVRASNPGVDSEQAWSRATASVLEPWSALQSQASKLKVGFVVRDAEAWYLTSPDATWGVNLLGAVEDMGFGVELLVHVSDPELAKRAARTLRQLFKDPSRCTLRAFDSFAHLRQRLRDSEARAFFSYQTFDWRLSEAGKARFSLQHFEMGPQGALRTLQRILAVCGTPFYRRYTHYLQRSRVGLRASAGSAPSDPHPHG